MKLVQAMGEEGKDAMGAWTKEEIVRYVLSLTATAVQRGNAKMMLAGRMWALRVSGMGYGNAAGLGVDGKQ